MEQNNSSVNGQRRLRTNFRVAVPGRRRRWGFCRRWRCLCCIIDSVSIDSGDKSCSGDLSELSISLSQATLSEDGEEADDSKVVQRLPGGFNYHAQFICVGSDLHVAEKVRRHVSQLGLKSVIFSEDAIDGKMDVTNMQEFCVRSLWNVIIVSPQSFDDEQFGFQSKLAVSIAKDTRKASVVILHARKNMRNFLPPMLLPFRQIHKESATWLQTMTRLISSTPAPLIKYRNPFVERTLGNTRLSLSDETLRVKKQNEAERSELCSLRDSVRLQVVKNMKQNIKEKIQECTSPLQNRKKVIRT